MNIISIVNIPAGARRRAQNGPAQTPPPSRTICIVNKSFFMGIWAFRFLFLTTFGIYISVVRYFSGV